MAEPGGAAAAAPLPAVERIAWLDAARGFALLGVLAVNLTAMASAEWLYRLAGAPRDVPLWDDAADLVRDGLLYGRSLALLSLLFGSASASSRAATRPIRRAPAAATCGGWRSSSCSAWSMPP